MVYYMIGKPNKAEMNICRDEIAAIRKKVEAKYPATKCGSWNEKEMYGRQRYKAEMYEFHKELDALTAPYYQKRKAHGLEVLDRIGIPMLGKRKAELVRECAIRMKATGLKEAWVVNYVFSDGDTWVVMQSWYVYEDGGQYFFKMSKTNKTSHIIEGVF